MKEIIKAACGQMFPKFGDTEGNLEKVFQMTRQAKADLIVFPELATSGYEFKDREEAMKYAIDLIDGAEVYNICKVAKETGAHIVLGVPEKAGDKLYNSTVLISPLGEVTVYRKLHLFDREKELFDRGNIPLKAVDTEIGRLGLMLCFDWIFPETARLLSLDGAQIICHPANLVLPYCQRAMFARSIENGVFTITCNRIGAESRIDRELSFTGYSQILSNRGGLLAQAGSDSEEIISVEIKPADADDKMMTKTNHLLNDRITAFYGGLTA